MKATGPLSAVQFRSVDLLNVRLSFENIQLEPQSNDPGYLRAIDGTQPAYIIVETPPQHYLTSTDPVPTYYASGSSRFVFNATPILPLEIAPDEGDLRTLILSALSQCSLVPGGVSQTQLELPYGLLSSLMPTTTPAPGVRPATVANGGTGFFPVGSLRLFQATNGQVNDVAAATSSPVNWDPSVWRPDARAAIDITHAYPGGCANPPPTPPAYLGLNSDLASGVIQMTSAPGATPLQAGSLLVTGMGATTFLSRKKIGISDFVATEATAIPDTDSFDNHLSVGEDNFWKYSIKLFAWPVPNWMSWVTIYDRQEHPLPAPSKDVASVFRFDKNVIRLNERVVVLPDNTARALGFTALELGIAGGGIYSPAITGVAAAIPAQFDQLRAAGVTIYRMYLVSDGTELRWNARWTDFAGNAHSSNQLSFLYLLTSDYKQLQSFGNSAAAQSQLTEWFNQINSSALGAARARSDATVQAGVSFGGDRVQIVGTTIANALTDNVTFALQSVVLAGEIVDGKTQPRAMLMNVGIPALAKALGSSPILPYRFDGVDVNGFIAAGSSYVADGLIQAASDAAVFANLVSDAAPGVTSLIPDDAKSTLASAAATFPQLSAAYGALSAKLVDPKQYGQHLALDAINMAASALFDEVKLFGLVSLGELLDQVKAQTKLLGDVPRAVAGFADDAKQIQQLMITTDFLISKGAAQINDLVSIINNDRDAVLQLRAEIQSTLQGILRSRRVSYVFPEIAVTLFGAADGERFVQLIFDSVTLVYDSTSGVSVSAPLTDVRFLDGPLSALASLLGALDGSKNLIEDLEQLKLQIETHLPDFALGAFALRNLKIFAQVALPKVTGLPSFAFSLASPLEQFSLSVGPYSGFGYTAVTIDNIGPTVADIEFGFAGSLDFGASLAVDFAIASGSVSAHAGFYYSSGPGPKDLATGAELELRGSLSVLDVLDINAYFYLSMGYAAGPNGGRYVGEAILHVDISLFFFSISADIHCHREFGQGGTGALRTAAVSPPTLGTWFAGQWPAYCAAFEPAKPGREAI